MKKPTTTSEIVQEDEFDKDMLTWFRKSSSTHQIVVMRGETTRMVIGGSMAFDPECDRCDRLERAARAGLEAIKSNLGWEDSESDVDAVKMMEEALRD